MRILFADDVTDLRELYSLILSLEGLSTTTAANGLEAVTAVRESQEPFDVVVLGIGMPRMDGWEALQAIRELPQGKDLPIIMFSAHEQELKTRAAASSANGVLHKPATPSQVVEMMKRVVEQAKKERQ